ncbi:SUN domain-containing protein 3 [Ornithorhynchus anatinus]|uniref:SUN domain-containing protein 3 n=1 Tax=Ornithorhynchus anatinus TaxID=9258 RepID=F6YNE8_ORNAN|nr:SUN domain-containing protein 3 [Ornithorhynchus anatinus]
MSARLNLRRNARFSGIPSEEAKSGTSRADQQPEVQNLNPPRKIWKIITTVVLLLILLLSGFYNKEWLKETRISQNTLELYDVLADYGFKLYQNQVRGRDSKGHQERLRMGTVDLKNNLREILALKEQINTLKAELNHAMKEINNFSLHADGDVREGQGRETVSDKEMSKMVNYVLKKLREDQVEMADYALKSAGASIVEAGTSENYKNEKAKLYWYGLGFLNYEMPPDVILQPAVHPGNCWAFPGPQGHAIIKLARKVIPKAVTLEHISERISPSGNITSAPKDFSIYGLRDECEGEGIFLGQFMYDKTGTAVQTFHLKVEVSEFLSCVKLKILTNWGHPKFTCVYRFRVHGNPESNM